MILSLTPKIISNIIKNAKDAKHLLDEMLSLDSETIASENTNYYAFSYCFVVYSQAILTLSNFISIKRGFGIPKSFYESLLLMIDNDVIKMDDAKDYARLLVDLRNAILHGNSYKKKEDKIENIKNNLNAFKLFFSALVSEVEKIIQK